MTTQPLAAILGDHSLDTLPPADIRQKSMPVKSKVARSLHLSVCVAERHLHADRPARGERVHLPDGEQALAQDRQHFPAHVARGADDGDAIAHGALVPSVPCNA